MDDRDKEQERGGREIDAALASLLAGEAGATERLAALLRPDLMAVAGVFLAGSAHEPEDVVQDSLVALLAWLAERQSFEGSLNALAATICRNRCRDLLRWRSRHPDLPLDKVEGSVADTFLDPLEAMLAEEARAGLRKAFARLDAPCRDLLLRIYGRGEKVKDIALSLGVKSVQVVYYRRGSCLKKLRELL